MASKVAIDIGGTFVDAIAIDTETGDFSVEKVPTVPSAPAEGVVAAIEKLDEAASEVEMLIHGTTLGVNALIERDGATVGILTNTGFRDIFELGRYDVPDEEMYNFSWDKPDPLVPRRRRLEVPGRLNYEGDVVNELDEDAIRQRATTLVEDHGVDSIVVAFLHSYRNDDHERRAASILHEMYPDISVTRSSALTKEHYEYERTSTAVLNGYVKPIFESYVDELVTEFERRGFDGHLQIARSGGGALPAESAKETPIHTLLSGPAGGLIGASHVGSVTGRENLITMDMGGTSLDTCVITDGVPSIEYEAEIQRLPLLLPVFDIRTIGAGGGSVAWVDGDLLKVGPTSAGSEPGPICYGRGGDRPTVTDAALQLGYIPPEGFLGGDMELDVEASKHGIGRDIANPLGLSTFEAAKGIVDVTANKHVGAIREITVEQGLDPREYSIVAFGGAGPMLAPVVARELGAKEVVVPRAPSVFSAWGMLMADVTHDFSKTYLRALDEVQIDDLQSDFESLEARAIETLDDEGYGEQDQSLRRSLEMRYVGQEQTVEVDATDVDTSDTIKSRFAANHKDQYGHTLNDRIEIVYLRVRGIGDNPTPPMHRLPTQSATEPAGTREIYCFARDERVDAPVYHRIQLGPDDDIEGPAIIQEPTTGTIIHSDQEASVDDFGHLFISEVI